MGSDLGLVYNALWQQLAWLHSKWAEYIDLFGTKESRVTLMNEAAPRFFRVVQDSLFDDVLLHIARLTDPPKSAGRDNLTIQRLPSLIADPTMRAEVSAKIELAKKASAFCRDWRNRRIAHGDYDLALDRPATPLMEASRLKVREAMEALVDVINAVGLHYLDTTNLFNAGPSHEGALSLLYVLDSGLQAKRERSARISSGQYDPKDFELRDL